MTAPIKVIIMLVVWLLYSIVAYKGCLEQCCTSTGNEDVSEAIIPAEEETPDTETAATRYPIDFQWANAAPNTNAGYEVYRKDLLAKMTENNILEITGLYYKEEPKPDGFENMGFARAERTKQLFADVVPPERIKTRARLVDTPEGAENIYLDAVRYNWIEAEETTAGALEELDDRIIIRFGFNSVYRDVDPAVDEYLDKLANRVKASGEEIVITGHTDNVGDSDANLVLGERRAKQIRDILTKKGVSATQIAAKSEGESQPVDTNDTEEGRHNNRRAEVRLIKQ